MTTPERLVPVLTEALSDTALVLEDVTVSPAGKRRVVRVVVDHALASDAAIDTPTEPLSLDEVADATRLVNVALDDSDVMGSGPYTLEVSSPGVSRPLTEWRHFARNVGRLVKVSTGGGAVTGRVVRVDGDGVTLEVAGSKKEPARQETLPLPEITRGEVQVEFNRPGDDSDSHNNNSDDEES